MHDPAGRSVDDTVPRRILLRIRRLPEKETPRRPGDIVAGRIRW
jgi:hypothetical protein